MAGNDDGCIWIMSRSQRWDGRLKRYVKVPVFCHKMTAPDSPYCPKHDLLAKALGYPQEQGAPGSTTYAKEGRNKR